MMRDYLGDAVYVDFDRYGRVVLTTEDGISATNTIVFEPEVLEAFELWVSRLRATLQAKVVGE